jgi:hypothetical protein
MKGGNSSNNGPDLDKGNILKPTYDTLMEEDLPLALQSNATWECFQ